MLRVLSIEPEREPHDPPGQNVDHRGCARPQSPHSPREPYLVAPPAPAPDAARTAFRHLVTRTGAAEATRSIATELILQRPTLASRFPNQRRGAERQMREQVPWLSRVRLPWGIDLQLLDISTSGILVETTAKFTPGSRADFHLLGSDTELVVPGRFVRSEVAAVDSCSVKYRAAATFEKPLDLRRPGAGQASVPSAFDALRTLLTRVLADLNHGRDTAALRVALEQGLSELVPARAFLIRRMPIESVREGESLYFNVPAGSVPRTVLQVTFDPDRGPTETEFRVLKAAALLAAAVLEFDPQAL